MSYRYQGKGYLQITGRNNMATSGIAALTAAQVKAMNSPITISGSGLSNAAGQTISLSNHHNWSNLTSASSIFSFEDKTTHELLRKYEVYESTEDILALSVTAHRLMQETSIYYKLTDRDLFKKVSPEDRVMADQIKDYYSKKVMMWKLKGNGKLSAFRDDMNKLIHSDGLMFKENVIGIAYWLPRFYQYDLDLDMIKSQVTQTHNFENMDKQGQPNARNLSTTLTPIKRIKRVSKRTKAFEYWFKDDILNAGVVLHLEEKNQLQHLWDYMFENESTIKIKGNYIRRHRDGFEYFSINNWEIDRG